MIKHQALRHLRIKQGWTQGYAAQQIGIQQSYLSKLENGQAIPSFEVLSAIGKAYGCNMRTLAPLAKYPESSYKLTSNTQSFKLIASGTFVLLLASLLFLIVWLGLITSNTAYTYQLLPDSDIHTITPTYLVTDSYRGEKFEEQILEAKVGYKLIGERDITSIQNKLLYVVSLLLFIVGTALIISGLYLRQKN